MRLLLFRQYHGIWIFVEESSVDESLVRVCHFHEQRFTISVGICCLTVRTRHMLVRIEERYVSPMVTQVTFRDRSTASSEPLDDEQIAIAVTATAISVKPDT